MAQKVKEQEKVTGIVYSEMYSKHEVAKLFSCLSPEVQDELLSIMRKMVAENKAAQATERMSAQPEKPDATGCIGSVNLL